MIFKISIEAFSEEVNFIVNMIFFVSFVSFLCKKEGEVDTGSYALVLFCLRLMILLIFLRELPMLKRR